ncbi:MAG: EamA family transporter [Eggerthellaceae bacterium]|nr:EamA family transporter [Eggerthellaceae bacterium]
MNKSKATAAFVSSLCIYGTIGWALAYVSLPNETVVLFRGAIGTAFILVVLLLTKRRIDLPSVRDNLLWLAAGGLSLGFNWVFLFSAYRVTTVAVACLCNYMGPVIFIFVAPIILKEKRSLKKIVCALVAVGGMVLVSGVVKGGAEGVTAEGICLGLGAAMFFVTLLLANKKLGEIPVLERSVVQLAFATLPALPFVLVNGICQTFTPDALSIGLVVMLGIVHTGLAYCLYFGGLSGLSGQTAAVLGYVEPAVAVLVSTLILHEPLSVFGWVGAILIIGAAAISEIVE